MSSSKAAIIAGIVGLMSGAILISALERHYFSPEKDVSAVVDTLVVRDTIVEKYPLYVTHTVVDTMLVAIRDTVTVRDTAYVVVEREQRHYRGDDYDAWVSGWRPALDSIMVYPETRYITSESISVTSRKRWGIGIHAGYGIGVSSGQVRTFPYIGVGISYDLVQF